jgi:rhodanese-related sulfurtransferase
VPTTEQEVPRIAPEALKAKLDAGEDIVIVDARSLAEYETAHIEGAISIPLAEIDNRYNELPRDKGIVLYCTWPAEQTSARAALRLYQHGFTNVSALLGGLRAWEAADYPMVLASQWVHSKKLWTAKIAKDAKICWINDRIWPYFSIFFKAVRSPWLCGE